MRGGSGYITTLEDLQTWFTTQPRVEWTLMNGFQDGVQQKGVIYKNGDAESSKEDAWALLRQMIEINSTPGARFTVFVPSNEHGNRGYTVKLQLGEAPSPYQLAGLGGAPGYHPNGYVTKAEIASEIAKERKIWELEQKIKDMEAARLNGMGDALREKLLETDLTPVVTGFMTIINTVVKNLTSKHEPLAVSVQGAPGDEAPTAQGEAQTGGYEYQGDRLIPCLDRIRPHFTDEESFYTFMDKISAKFAENPAMYKALLS